MTLLVGEGIDRVDGPAKVTGVARYSAEQAVPGLLEGALVLSPAASGRIDEIDTSPAAALPGVVAVLTHQNVPRLAPSDHPQWLQDTVIHHAGQPVALVLAESSLIAHEAASRVRIVLAEADPVADIGRELAPSSVLGEPPDSRRGDVGHALARAAAVVEETYATPAHVHSPMEPNAVVAKWEGDRVTVHTSTSGIFAARDAIARTMRIPVENVHVLMRFQGGGFGCKGSAWWPSLVLAVASARSMGRPVRLALTRGQMFSVLGRRSPTIQRIAIAATHDGRLTAIDHVAKHETSPFADYCDSTCFPSRIVYACPNVAVRHRTVRVNAPQPNAMRAPGEGPGSFALESALDELAHALNIDPVALRLRNLPSHDQHHNRPWTSNGLDRCLLAGAQAFGWKHRSGEIGGQRDGRWRVGWGMAAAYYPVFQAPAAVRLRRETDGTIVLQCGNQDIGTGSVTVMRQAVARELGVEPGAVRVDYGDTTLPETPMAAGSMSSASVIPAVEAAARELRASTGMPSEVEARSAPPEVPARTGHAFGACFVEARVDPELGIVRVTRITAAYAAGRILNAKLARSQYIGGIVFGLGMALHEHVQRDPHLGHVVNSNLSEYLIPTHADMPDIDVHLIEEDDDELATARIKGIGMIGTVGVAAAVANAVFHATGRRIRRLPILPEALLDEG